MEREAIPNVMIYTTDFYALITFYSRYLNRLSYSNPLRFISYDAIKNYSFT